MIDGLSCVTWFFKLENRPEYRNLYTHTHTDTHTQKINKVEKFHVRIKIVTEMFWTIASSNGQRWSTI